MARGLVVIIISLAVPFLVAGCRPAEPKFTGHLEVGEPDPADIEPMFFHDKCAGVLKTFVDSRGMVDYERLRRRTDQLATLLEEFSRLDHGRYSSWPKAHKMAFWINAYNLQKLKVVVDNYPVTPSSRVLAAYWGPNNIRHIERKISGHRFLVMDEQYTFAQVEKRFFRDQFDDPRIVFALTSASLSGPPLRNEPYYGSRLGEQLDDQVKRFLSSRLAFAIDREQRIVYLSAMFELSSWGREFIEKFATDRKFRGHPPPTRAALNFITNYISEKDISFLEVEDYSVKYMKHDWTINDSS
ncbi:MAG: DUF547 domain-containing protein [Planctomycetota bacterium]|jgi:hypothetical protein